MTYFFRDALLQKGPPEGPKSSFRGIGLTPAARTSSRLASNFFCSAILNNIMIVT